MANKTIKVSKSTSYTDKIGRIKRDKVQLIQCGKLQLVLDDNDDLYIVANNIGILVSGGRPLDTINRYIQCGKIRESDIKGYMETTIHNSNLPKRVALTEEVYKYYYDK